MCRWVAYQGSPIYLEDILVKPEKSLLHQCRFAEENIVKGIRGIPDGKLPINDDGFGIGWYGERPFPGVYKDISPAWNDRNYLSIASHTKSGLFLGHLRAAYHGIIQRTNCHPFRHYNWLFQHNGEIDRFLEIKRDIALAIDPSLFSCIEGTTDSEYIFYLMLTFGLKNNPKKATEKTICFIEDILIKKDIESPFKLTAAFSDGESVFAVRYSNNKQDKSLYTNKNENALSDYNQDILLPKDGKLLVSEPLSADRSNWEKLPESSFITLCHKAIDIDYLNL